jgi:succinate dehydrogenase / fumarate reductase cytochrome b subunit
MAIFFGTSVLLYILQISLTSAEGFDLALQMMERPLISLIIWVILAAVVYHLIAGTKHLLLDLGLGETKNGAKIGAFVVVILFLLSVPVLSILLLWK